MSNNKSTGGRSWRMGDWADCRRCGHTWRVRNDRRPGVCPKCKDAKWDGVVGAVEGGGGATLVPIEEAESIKAPWEEE